MNHWLSLIHDKVGRRNKTRSIDEHIEAAAQWILHAQRSTPDDGVAHSYDLRRRKWLASYPETTGYIIPTLYDYALHFNRPSYRDAALRMARWEVAVQLPDGGVRAGTMAAETIAPTVFNTGQVLFGLARAAQEPHDPEIGVALRRAADWLVAAQDEDGCWRRFHSPFTTTKTAAYNTRTAFGLLRAFDVTQDQRHLDAAERNIEWALSQASPNGWLPGNCLTHNDDDSALTHTLAYSIRGILEVGVKLNRPAYVEHSLKMAAALAKAQRADGSLPAYCDPNWKGVASWTCVTGNSQMALNWLRLANVTGESTLSDRAVGANRFNMSVQDLDTEDRNLRGAIKGSHPINGGYMTWRYPNWAAKFFMDALMLEKLNDRVTVIG